MTKGTAYGVGSGPYVKVFPAPTVSRRDPLPTDHLDIGQTWVNTVTNGVWVLTSITNGQATWTTSPAAGAGVFTDLTATGTIDLTSAVTSIYHVTGAGQNVDIASVLGSVPITAGEAVANAIGLTATNGGVEVDADTSFNVDAESISLDAQVASDFTVTGGAGDDLTLSGNGGSVNIISTEAVANAIFLNATTGGIRVDTATTLDLNLTTGFTLDAASLSLDATLASNFTVTGAGEDLTLNSVGGSLILTASEADASAITIDATDAAGGINIDSGTDGITIDTTGGISIDAQAGSNFTVTAGAGDDLTLSAAGSSVNILASEADPDAIFIHATDVAGGVTINSGTAGTGLGSTGQILLSTSRAATNAIRLNATNANGGIDITSLLGGVTVDTTAGIALTALTNSNFTVTGAAADLSLGSAGGSVNITATEAAADAIAIDASNAAGGIDIIAGTGHLDITVTGGHIAATSTQSAANAILLDATGVNGGVTLTTLLGGITGTSTGAVSLGAAATSNFTVTGAAADLTLSSVGGSVNVLGSQAAADAVRIFASNAAGGIDVDCGTGNFTLDSTGSFSIDGATASNVTVTGAGIDLTLSSVGGSVEITSTENTTGAVTLLADGGVLEKVVIQANQGTAADSVDIISSVGGVSVTTGALAATTGLSLTQGAATIPIQVGAGAPTHNAPKGTLYLRTDGTTTNDRAYINTNGTNGWTSLTTAA